MLKNRIIFCLYIQLSTLSVSSSLLLFYVFSCEIRGPDTAIVASLDGTIYLLEVGSMKPVWSFSSGSHIYSSYQAPVNDKENASEIEGSYFIDCGDDWELYAHNSLGKLVNVYILLLY